MPGATVFVISILVTPRKGNCFDLGNGHRDSPEPATKPIPHPTIPATKPVMPCSFVILH